MVWDHDSSDGIESIRAAVQAFRKSQVYIAFAELEIGPALEGNHRSLHELAERVSAVPAALGRFLDAAEALGLVTRDDNGRFTLTDLGRAAYAPSSSQSISHSLKLEGAFYRRWGRLAEAVRLGGRPESNRAQEGDPCWVHMFTMALFENSRSTANAVARTISQIFPDPGDSRLRVLDLGGGHGGYSIALARVREDVEATVFDLPPVIETTRQIVSKSDVKDRVTPVAGDFHQDSIGTSFDAVLLFGVLHGETPEQAETLLQRIHESLRADGQLLIRSRGRQQGEPEPGERELLDLHMLLSTSGGRVHRSTDTQALVEQHGFQFSRELLIEPPGQGAILVFRRD